MVGTSPTLLFSAYFGTLNLEKAAILSFPQGLPGFETERQFAAIQIPGQHPLIYLQSVATPDLCLLTFPVNAIDSNYRLHVSAEDRDTLELPATEILDTTANLLALAIVSVEQGAGATANMAAPLVVNLKTNLVLQAVQPDHSLLYNFPLNSLTPPC